MSVPTGFIFIAGIRALVYMSQTLRRRVRCFPIIPQLPSSVWCVYCTTLLTHTWPHSLLKPIFEERVLRERARSLRPNSNCAFLITEITLKKKNTVLLNSFGSTANTSTFLLRLKKGKLAGYSDDPERFRHTRCISSLGTTAYFCSFPWISASFTEDFP